MRFVTTKATDQEKLKLFLLKPFNTLKYIIYIITPKGVKPCLKTKDKPNDVYKYTAKENLVAVTSNGTAVLGLGDKGSPTRVAKTVHTLHQSFLSI